MKGKLLGILIILCLLSFFLGIKLNYPPYENELAVLITTKLTSPGAQLDKEAQPAILNNILGEERFLNEKLFSLRSKLQIIAGTRSVLNLRTVNFFLLAASLVIFYFFLKQNKWESRTALFSLFPVLISPLFLSLWMLRPKICLTIFFIMLWLYLWSRKNTNLWSIGLLIISPLFLFFSSFQGLIISLLIFVPLTIHKFYQAKKFLALAVLGVITILLIIPIVGNPAFKNNLSQAVIYGAVIPNQTGKQVEERISKEDGLQTRVVFPLLFRRMGYNKIFFAYRNFVKEVLGFFDLETLFFQEVHPTHQKSEVVFFWPEIFLFCLGIWGLIKTKFSQKHKVLLILTFISLIFYLITTNDSPAGKHGLTLFPLAIIIGAGFKQIPKKLLPVILLLLVWAIYINSYDVLKRPLFWYDNRPYVYSQGIEALKKAEPEFTQDKDIYFTTLVGNPKLYYFYYYSPNPNVFSNDPAVIKDRGRTIHFTSFDLKNNLPQKKTLYFGFLGEFIGPHPLNEFSKEDINKIKIAGLEIEKVWKLDNTIAFRYGDYFVLTSVID